MRLTLELAAFLKLARTGWAGLTQFERNLLRASQVQS